MHNECFKMTCTYEIDLVFEIFQKAKICIGNKRDNIVDMVKSINFESITVSSICFTTCEKYFGGGCLEFIMSPV